MKGFFAFDALLLLIFACSVGLTVVGALMAVGSARIIRSVCGLAVCCLGLAGVYYYLHSPFLALMEILIYIGAICVTIVFAIMLAEPDEVPPDESLGTRVVWSGLAVVVSVAVFGGLCVVGLKARWPDLGARTGEGSVAGIGVALLTTYSLAFELISLVLLVAILGALAIARPGRRNP